VLPDLMARQAPYLRHGTTRDGAAVLERIENHVSITANRNQRLADGQRRAAISKADLDDRAGPLGNQ
jgi:hypothetical protein